MSDVGQKVVFRHGKSGNYPRLTVCISLIVFLATCGIALSNRGYWVPLTLLCGVVGLLFSYLAYIKLEIWGSGFYHRNLSGNHAFEFEQVDDLLFETVSVGDAYEPVLSVKLKGGRDRMKIPIGMFPIRASAMLFTALDRHGIPIRLDESRLVQNKMRRISEAQSKILAQRDRDAVHA